MAAAPETQISAPLVLSDLIIERQRIDVVGNAKVVNSTRTVVEPTEDAITFWTRHTKPVLSSLLKASGSYNPVQQATHLRFLDDFIIPSMGRVPDEFRSRSLMTPTGSPFETSLNYCKNGKQAVRFCFEPVFPGVEGITEDPIARIAEEVGADLRWYKQFAEEFQPTKRDKEILIDKMPKDTVRIPDVFFAFDLSDEKQTMKAYFYPIIKYMTEQKNSDRAGFDLIRRLDPLGPSFEPALTLIERYHKQLYLDPPLTVVIGVDCIRPEDGARVKIYTEPRTNSWRAVEEHVTLGGQLDDDITTEGLAILRDMWNTLTNEAQDKPIDASFEKEVPVTTPPSSGLCFSWELRPGQAVPETKVYVSLPAFFKTDSAIATNVAKIFAKFGWAWGDEGAYEKVIGDAYGCDILDDSIDTRTVHTAISFNFSKKKGAYISTYIAPFIRFS